MYMIQRTSTLGALAALVIAFAADVVFAATTPFVPDAWTRGNNANTSYFGWDFLEHSGEPDLGLLWILDDVSPDLGSAGVDRRIYQGNDGRNDPSPNEEGHVSSTHNYYSFTEKFDAKIVSTAPASGSGGFTTVVLQLRATNGGFALGDLLFNMDVGTWTLQKHLKGVNSSGSGFHWVEWTSPGDDLPFQIRIGSAIEHRAVDSFQIDTFWSPTAPVVNAITAVPEPAACWLAVIGLGAGLIRRRQSRVRVRSGPER